MIIDEKSRLRALHRYRVLDTGPEKAFDDLTMLAAHICDAPIALISLVDKDRQWFKSSVGLTEKETPRDISFCSHAIQQQDLFVVPDASLDVGFKDNPLVTGDWHIRFYAGKPLVTPEGDALGTLCVMDVKPRVLTTFQKEALEALQRQAQAQLELRRNIEELRAAIEGMEALSALVPYCSTCELNMVIPADMEAMSTVRAGVIDLLTKKQWPDHELMKVELAVQEALTNAIRHGCKNDSSKQVQCCVSFDAAGEIVIVVRDPGPGFDVAAVPDPLEESNLWKASGRGVFLINQVMDVAEFTDGGRQVLMRKRREPEA